MIEKPGAVCQVQFPGIQATIANESDGLMKSPRLLQREGRVLFLSARQVGERPAQAQAVTCQECVQDSLHIVPGNSQTVHSRVDFQMDRHALPGSTRSLGQTSNRRNGVDCGHQPVSQGFLLLARPAPFQHQDLLSDARLAQCHSLFHNGQGKTAGAGTGQGPSHGNRAVTVSIGLDDRNDPRSSDCGLWIGDCGFRIGA